MSNNAEKERNGSGTSPIRLVVVDSDHAELARCKNALLATNLVEVCAETTSYTLAASQINRSHPHYFFCAVGANPGLECDLISKIRMQHPAVQIVCIGTRNDSDDILKCFRAGANEFLVKPLQREELLQVFQRLQNRQPALNGESKPNGRVLAVWGSRGGCGTTTIACNLAARLAQSRPAVLADFNFGQGDLAFYFDLQPEYSLMDISGSGERIDETLIDSVAIAHDSGLRLLLQPSDQHPVNLNAEELSKLLRVLQTRFDFTVLDIGHDSIDNTLLSFISEIYLVVNQNLPSLYLAARKVQRLETLGFARERVSVLVNSYNKRGAISHSHIDKALGIANVIYIRKDERAVLSAVNRGIPLWEVSRWGKAAKDITRFADSILSPQASRKQLLGKGELESQPLPQDCICTEAAR